MGYAQGRRQRIVFGAAYKFNRNYSLELKLKNNRGESLGIDLKLSRSILKDQGEAYIRLLGSRKEGAISAGAGFRW
jgi:hypothetical protein